MNYQQYTQRVLYFAKGKARAPLALDRRRCNREEIPMSQQTELPTEEITPAPPLTRPARTLWAKAVRSEYNDERPASLTKLCSSDSKTLARTSSSMSTQHDQKDHPSDNLSSPSVMMAACSAVKPLEGTVLIGDEVKETRLGAGSPSTSWQCLKVGACVVSW